MEKRSSHSQNCTLLASTLFTDNVRRRGKGKCGRAIQNSSGVSAGFFFSVILLSFSSKSLLAGEQRSSV